MRNIVLGLIFVCFVFSFNVFAQEAKKDIIYLVDTWPPSTIKVGDKFEGIDIVIVEELARRMNLNIVYKEAPWARCLKMMEEGSGDLLSQCLKRPEREAYMHYIEPPYAETIIIFYVKKGAGVEIESYDDLKDLKIGVTFENKYFEPFDNDSALDKLVVNDEIQVLKMLEKNRIDTFLMHQNTADYLIAKEGFIGKFEKAEYKIIPDGNNAFCTISRKSKFAEDVDIFNATMKEMKEDGTLQRLTDKFFEDLRNSYK